jgi:2-keto-3-deoxy-L-rhamnonate aldolase RhmA
VTANSSFRQRLIANERLAGVFVKTPAPQVIEILGAAGFDFVVIDAEHAPFDRTSTDLAILAARAAKVEVIVRTPNREPSVLSAPLDDGAAGVVAPHVDSADTARQLVAACRYSYGRGYSNSPRGGGYGARPMWDHIAQADATAAVIAMIEDPQAVKDIDEILAVDGVDAILVGRADLTVAMDDRTADARHANAAAREVLAAARRAGKPACIALGAASEAGAWFDAGATVVIISSDQALLKSAALDALKTFADLVRADRPQG